MNKSFFTKQMFIFVTTVSMLCSCMEKDIYQGGKNQPLNPTEVFDFSLTKQVKLNVNYGFTNDYYVIFELYDQNPMMEQDDSWIRNEKLTPVYSASTDKKGQYSGSITLPSDIMEVWLYSDYPGVASPVKLSVSNSEINFSQEQYIASLQAQTKGVTADGHKYPEDWMTMPGVSWDIYGLPSNIESSLNVPSADILYSVKKAYSNVSKEYISKVHYEDWLKNNISSEIKITKDTELSLVFISIGATTWKNAVGYFTYPTGTIPTESTIQKVLAFPNATSIDKTESTGERKGALQCGHEVKLKYWNKDKQQFEDKFPAGVTVGWCLEGNSFDKGNILKRNYGGSTTRYSYSSMNSEKAGWLDNNMVQRVVALRHGATNQIVTIGFEDNSDFNYCDAIFYLQIAEANAISTDGPELPSTASPEGSTITYKGTVTFEDQWPDEGDYDMNDVMMEYQSTLYKRAVTNKIYKIVDEFTPVHNGGTFKCGFGYQLHNLQSNEVKSVDVKGPEGWNVETGQSHPTIILYDDIKKVMKQKFTVTIELADANENTTPPYNPFIFVQDRSREVHLVNYPPTDKADMGLFNTGDDKSNISAGIYYITRYKEKVDLMPFGINFPNTLNLQFIDEGVKIYNSYPNFIEWVESKGAKATDWYKK